MVSAPDYFSDIARSGPPLFFPDPASPVTFNFDQGVPAEETFPLEDIARLHQAVLDRDGGRSMEYISMGFDEENNKVLYLSTYIELVLGNTTLREELASWLNRTNEGADITPNGVIVTSGSVQAIALAVNAFVEPGDAVLVEAATFPYALRYMDMRGGKITPIEIDDDGLNTDSLEVELKRLKAEGIKPKLLYVIATFQLPTGACTSLERRRRILELAEEYDFLVLEDNIYGNLRYSGEALPTLLSLDTTGRVIQTNGFSKTVAPALRIGWAAGPEGLIAGLAAVRQDLGPSQWTCRAMADYLAEGLLDDHIVEANDVYRRKRDVAAAAVLKHCSPYATFPMPDGGFYLWLTLSDDVDWEKVRVMCEAKGVAFRPGERFMVESRSEAGKQYLRLAFSHVSESELDRGIEALGDAIKASVR